MKRLVSVASCLWFLAGASYAMNLQKKADGFTCSSPPTSILCPSLKTVNAEGLNVLEALYFGLQNTSLPDSTTYNAGENIICVTHSSGPTIDLSGNVGASYDGVSAGLGFAVNLTIEGLDNGGIYTTSLDVFLRLRSSADFDNQVFAFSLKAILSRTHRILLLLVR